MTYREWLALNTQIAAEFHHQRYPVSADPLLRRGGSNASSQSHSTAETELLPPREYLWVDNRLVIIDTERWKNLWCLI